MGGLVFIRNGRVWVVVLASHRKYYYFTYHDSGLYGRRFRIDYNSGPKTHVQSIGPLYSSFQNPAALWLPSAKLKKNVKVKGRIQFAKLAKSTPTPPLSLHKHNYIMYAGFTVIVIVEKPLQYIFSVCLVMFGRHV